MKVIHIITALESGGAEKVLYQILAGLKDEFYHEVWPLSKRGMYTAMISNLGIAVNRPSPMRILKLIFCHWRHKMKKKKGERESIIVHSHLYHSHLLSLLFWIVGIPVLWSIHSSVPISGQILVSRIASAISYFVPKKIIFVSDSSRKEHETLGMDVKRSVVIYNGVDLVSCKKNKKLSKNKKTLANIAMISRYHPDKNYPLFCEIASRVKKKTPSKFTLLGLGNTRDNTELISLLDQYNLKDNVSLLGQKESTVDLLTDFNLVVSTSKNESFGLSIIEAIFAGVNVSTIDLKVMDELLGEYSPNVGNICLDEIAEIWVRKAMTKPDSALLSLVSNHFSLKRMIDSTRELYLGIESV